MEMGKIRWQGLAVISGVVLAAAACSGTSKTTKKDTPMQTTCVPSAARCDGLDVMRCADDGSAETLEETCSASQACSNGECVDAACAPGSYFCADGVVSKCDSSGASSTVFQKCGAGQFCREDNGSAYCSTQACTPGKGVCDGSRATTCSDDGSAALPGGEDCADSDRGCENGECRDMTCTPGTRFCQGGDVYLCGKSGASSSLWADCTAAEVCDADEGACRPKTCEPGKLDCTATRITQCNDFGSRWVETGTDCAAKGMICVKGACKSTTCTPGATFCQDKNVYQCDTTGTSSTLYQTCVAGSSHCTQYGDGLKTAAYCQSNSCKAGDVSCRYNMVVTCDDDGSWPATGTDCGADAVCVSGACKAKECDPNSVGCKDNAIWRCDPSGFFSYQLEQCTADATCQGPSGAVTCAPNPCSAGEATCIANQIGTCGTDNQTIKTVTDDCAASKTVCTQDLTCAKSAVDVLGVAENAESDAAGTMVGNVIDVLSARKLDDFSLNLVLPSARELRWVVFEQVNDNFVARIDKVVSNQSGTGYFTSPALNYALKVGKRYLLAVVFNGGNSSIVYTDSAPFSGRASFGTLVGRFTASYQTPVPVSYGSAPDQIYEMKTTTE